MNNRILSYYRSGLLKGFVFVFNKEGQGCWENGAVIVAGQDKFFKVMQKDAKCAVYYDIINANENKSTERR